MHQNAVKRGLVLEPGQWDWSSFRHYKFGEWGIVLVDELQKAELHMQQKRVTLAPRMPTRRKPRRVGQPILS